MESIKNSNVTKEVEKLLAPLKEKDIAQYNIIRNLVDQVYTDPTLHSPEATNKEIENRLYRMIDDHIQFKGKKS